MRSMDNMTKTENGYSIWYCTIRPKREMPSFAYSVLVDDGTVDVGGEHEHTVSKFC